MTGRFGNTPVTSSALAFPATSPTADANAAKIVRRFIIVLHYGVPVTLRPDE
jgi:hypothetical protein